MNATTQTPAMSRNFWLCLALITQFYSACWSTASTLRSPRVHASDQLFDTAGILEVTILLSDPSLRSLAANPKSYVKSDLTINGQRYSDVAIKLKGGDASFQSIHHKPSLTIKMDRYVADQTFYGLDKLQLNNCVQDTTYLRDRVASHIFILHGIPAPRGRYASVRINRRNLGLYLLKESIEKTFLSRWYGRASGNLYEGEGHMDIDQSLPLESGKGPKDHADLRMLYNASQLPDLRKRSMQLSQILDIDCFLRYLALEKLLQQENGYRYNISNYRIYCNPQDQRFAFIPTGLETTFQTSWGFKQNTEASHLGLAISECPELALQLKATEERLKAAWPTNRIQRYFETCQKEISQYLSKDKADEVPQQARDAGPVLSAFLLNSDN